MLPFQPNFPQHPNQNRSEGETNNSSLQQAKVPNNMSNNHALNPQFPVQPNNSNPHFGNGNGNIAGQYQLPLQNIPMGILPQGQFFTIAPCQPQGPFFHNNHLQGGQFNFHQLPGLHPGPFPQQNFGFPQFNPFAVPCMNPSMGFVNQGPYPQGSQNFGFPMNPQSGMMNSHQMAHNAQGQKMFIPSTMSQNAMHVSPINGQHLNNNSLSPLGSGQAQMQQTQTNSQSGVLGKSQGNHSKESGSNIPNANQGNDFTKYQQETANRGQRNMRFQKSNIHPMANGNGNSKFFQGKGSNDKGARNPHISHCKQETNVESPRSKPLALNYTEEEIKKWREERKKNHPSRINIEKKSEDQTSPQIIDSGAQKRRQQLKEILSKQAELGVEVAELPRDYLMDSENQANESEDKKGRFQKGRFQKRGNRRQDYVMDSENQANESEQNTPSKGRFQKRGNRRQRRGGANRFNKKRKLGDENDSSRAKPAFTKKQPTLLQKLLSADMKRDKSRILQAFRFMVLNNFFVGWPNKPLEFPEITVKGKDTKTYPNKGNGVMPTINEDEEGLDEQDILNEDVAYHEEISCELVKETESIGGENSEEEEEEEEGEITDQVEDPLV